MIITYILKALIPLLGKPDDFFLLIIYFQAPVYKEIEQIRAYSFQTLVGNAGGYVGLFLGYTIKEIPVFLKKLFETAKRIRRLNQT